MTIRRRFARTVAAVLLLACAGTVVTSCDEAQLADLAAWHTAMTEPPAPTTRAQWAALRQCEASGNYGAVSKSGKYRGPYQMDRSFWLTYGGDPAYAPADRAGWRWEKAPTWMLDRVAYAGYRARGRQPWTSGGRCGYRLSI